MLDKLAGKTGVAIAAALAMGFANALYAAEETGGLKLPEDLAGKTETTHTPTYTIEERRIGGRLERVTIHRENGIDETYENSEVDSMWQTEDKELGETQNMRRWTIGSW